MRSSHVLLAASLSLAGLCACSSDDSAQSGEGGHGSGSNNGPVCTAPMKVPCQDQVIQQMNLQNTPAKGLITSDPDGAGFRSHIDATAGGAFVSKPDSYVYAKFTDMGLEKVNISDEQSLESMEWDIAFRRYVVRLNSSYSGPSCVAAARVPGMVTYESVTSAPKDLKYNTDDYFTDSCDLIPDGSGLMSSPATALASYWKYPGCVAMTGNVYVVRLASGKEVKFTVEDYYAPMVQTQCQQTGMVPMMDTGAANFVIRWAFLP